LPSGLPTPNWHSNSQRFGWLLRYASSSTISPGRRCSFDAEAGYQQPQAFNGRLLWGAAFARGPVRLCNGETIDA
jgi:hypothetical protein